MTNNPFIILLILSAIGAAIWFIVWLRQPKIFGLRLSQIKGSMDASTESKHVTPAGLTIYARSGVVTPEHIRLVDDAWLEETERAVREGAYEFALDARFYKVFIPKNPCQPSPEQRIDSFLIRADDYDGTGWDQWNMKGVGNRDGVGVVFAAEIIKSLDNGELFTCAGIANFKNAVAYGMQHILIFHNNRAWFDQTAVHDTYGHPLEYRPVDSNLTAGAASVKDSLIVPCK